MPVVPLPQQQVGPAALPDARLSPNAPATAFPGSVPTGVDLSGALATVERVKQEQQERADQVRVTAGVSQLLDAKNAGVSQLLQARGTNAMGMADQVQANFRKSVMEIQQSMTPAQQRAFQQHAMAEGLDLQVTVQRHLAAENQRVTDESYQGLDAKLLGKALQHGAEGDFAAVDADIDQRKAALTEYGRQIGMPKDEVDARIAHAVSQTRYAVFEMLSNSGQHLSASAYFKQHQGDFVGNDLMNAERVDAVGSVLGASQRQADTIVQSATDLDSALKQTQSIQEPLVREKTEQLVRQHFADVARATREKQLATYQSLYNTLRQNGGNYDALPIADTQSLPPSDDQQLRRDAEQIRNPKIVTNTALYTHLVNMASISDSTRAEFKKVTLMQYANQLAPAQMNHLRSLWSQINADGTVIQAAGARGATKDPDASVKRKEETTVIKQSDAAAKYQAQLHSTNPALAEAAKMVAPPAAVNVPQWMVDSAATDPEYREYLSMHGVPLPTASTKVAPTKQQPVVTTNRPLGNIAPPATKAPGAPIVRLSPQPPSE